jgi:hypothetical protein
MTKTRASDATFRAHLATSHPGLKPWAILSDHFMVKNCHDKHERLSLEAGSLIEHYFHGIQPFTAID